MVRAALGQRELDDGGSERLTPAEVPILRRRAAWMVAAAVAIGLIGAGAVFVLGR